MQISLILTRRVFQKKIMQWIRNIWKGYTTAVSNDCLREMKLPLLAAFNTLCILGSSLNYLQKLVLSITNKWDNPAHKSSWLSRSLGCHQLFLGASRSSRNSRKQLEFETNHVFDHFLAATSATNFFEGISGCIFCSPKISLMSHYWPLPKSGIFQK